MKQNLIPVPRHWRTNRTPQQLANTLGKDAAKEFLSFQRIARRIPSLSQITKASRKRRTP